MNRYTWGSEPSHHETMAIKRRAPKMMLWTGLILIAILMLPGVAYVQTGEVGTPLNSETTSIGQGLAPRPRRPDCQPLTNGVMETTS